MIFDLSRTIQWLREAALLPATYGTRRAQMEEIGLTCLFVSTLRVWGQDDTEGQQRTRRYLHHRLDNLDRLMVSIWGPRRPPGEAQADRRGNRSSPRPERSRARAPRPRAKKGPSSLRA